MEETKEIIEIKTYPEKMEEDFTKQDFVIRTIPSEFVGVEDSNFPHFKISTISQLEAHITSEYDFWKNADEKKSLEKVVFYSRLNTSKKHLNNAIMYYKSNDMVNGKTQLIACLNQLRLGTLFSKTELAQLVLYYKDKPSGFFEGFRYMFQSNKTNGISWSPLNIEGSYVALNFQGFLQNTDEISKNLAMAVEESAKTAQSNFAKLNKTYTDAFINQEKRIAEIKQQTYDEITNLKTNSIQYFTEKENRCSELEKLYSEKLKLQAPAEHWKKMGNSYSTKGGIWLGFGIGLAVIAVLGLLAIILYMPNIFDKDLHVFDVIKNSAIVTVIASIMIYIVRIFIKMALSSFHLARDAKEREQLAYFYLSLIEKDAVSEKERGLVINSLFSRSDTGLLKGEASPAMSANVGELVDMVSKVAGK